MRRCAFEGKTVDTSQGNVKRTPATIAAPSAPAGHQHQGIHRGIEMGRSKYTFLYHSARNRKFADSSPEGGGFELPVPGFRSSILHRSGAWNRKGPGSHSRVLTTDTSIFLPSRAHGGGKRIGPPKSPLGRGDHVARITWHSHPTTGGVLSSWLAVRRGHFRPNCGHVRLSFS